MEDRENRSDTTTDSSHLVDGKYSIKDLVDVEYLRKIMERFSAATGFTTGFVSYPEQELLFGTGWQEICTDFHRVCPASEEHCKESNRCLTGELKDPLKINVRPCDNGLVDGATPVIIKGVHVASLATGQVLFESPDLDRFRRQSETYGYDTEAYLAALSKVKVVSEEQFRSALSFLGELAVMIGDLGLQNLKMREGSAALQDEVDQRRRVEEELRKHQENLEELVRERTSDLRAANQQLQQTMEELRRSNRDLEQFAFVVSHDLHEPLRMVSSFTRLLESKYSDQLDEQANEYIAFAADGAERMQRLIKDLLKYSQVTSGTDRLKPIDCDDALTEALDNLKVAIQEADARLTRDKLPSVEGDQIQLVQLLQNLIGNALKFRKAEEPPAIHVSAERDGEQWRFSVSDNGIGVEENMRDRIFEVFQRGRRRGDYPGTGIGLSICRKIIEHHRGIIWVESTPGQGATFYFTLPVSSPYISGP